MSPDTVKILYLAHDLADPAVQRRVEMLRDGGADITVAGFRRAAAPIATVAGCPAVDLGRTHNGKFAQRSWSVLREVMRRAPRHAGPGPDVIIARNLEMLAIAVRLRSQRAVAPALVYESLDIHRLLLKAGPAGALLRRLEGWLARRASALITSSPAFVSAYFEPLSQVRLPVRLVENKVYDPHDILSAAAPQPRAPMSPWKIGWFGVIRCRKSLEVLCALAADSGGQVEVTIRGRPALDQIPDFHEIVAASPGVRFCGAYKYPDDLASIYREVHFTWAIDMYEQGLNSSWLLPNRLYEGGLFDAVPIALKTVATGAFLDRLSAGVTLDAPLGPSLENFFGQLTGGKYRQLEETAMAIPRSQWRYNMEDCRQLASYLTSLRKCA